MIRRNLRRDQSGSAVVEFAIAVPVLAAMIYGIFNISIVFMANAGMQHALGEAARYATIYPAPTDDQIQAKITASKFGLGNGTWDEPDIETDTTAHSKTITVNYSQPTSFLFFNGPTVELTHSKTVYYAY